MTMMRVPAIGMRMKSSTGSFSRSKWAGPADMPFNAIRKFCAAASTLTAAECGLVSVYIKR